MELGGKLFFEPLAKGLLDKAAGIAANSIRRSPWSGRSVSPFVLIVISMVFMRHLQRFPEQGLLATRDGAFWKNCYVWSTELRRNTG